jgi:hypothetical protein
LDELVDGGRIQWAEEFLFPPLLDQDLDGVNDGIDQFPSDPAASVDTDGDGMPDDWNPNATQEQIDASLLVLDDDDDNDGVSDEQELIDGTNPKDPADVITPSQGVSGVVYHWSNHTLLPDVFVERAESAAAGSATTTSVATTTDDIGRYLIAPTLNGSYQMRASLDLSSLDDRTITSSDALAALKIAVGINPNSDPDGDGPLQALPISPYQLIAADINQDGRVTSLDALLLLKLAVGISDAATPRWAFVEDTQSLWESNATQGNVFDANVMYSLVYPDQTEVNFAAILVGDVNGSWQAPADAATLDEAFFSESALASGAPLYLWGLRDSDGDGLTDTQEAALGTNPNLADSDSDGVDDALDAYPLDASRSAQASAPERIMAAAPLAGTSACGSNGPCESSQSSSEDLSSSTGAQERDVDPSTLIDLSSIAQPILLRGDMNDWGTDQAFTQTGEGEYQVLVTLKPGSYAFKVATADWMALDLGAASLEARSVEVGQPTALVLNSTEVLEVSVEATAAFVFTLVQTPAAAVHLVLSEEIVH